MSKKGKPQKKSHKVKKPPVNYESEQMKITIFNSFEEMNEADAKERAAFTPIQNLKMVTEYIKHSFAQELQDKMTDLTIHFKKDGHITT